MSLTLKIIVRPLGSNQANSKTMKFAPNMSISECCQLIAEKLADSIGITGADHGLFQNAEPGKRPARWLREDRTLQFYDIDSGSELEYKKKHRPLKIKLMDDSIKTLLINTTLTVGEIVDTIGERLTLSNSEEFSLKVEGRDEWLNSNQTLHEQGISDENMLLLAKKYFVNDSAVSIEDPVQLHLVYLESRDGILSGRYPCTQDDAVLFAALHMQINIGNYDPSRSTKQMDLKQYLPPNYHKNIKKGLDEKIFREHKKLVGLVEANAKYRYVQLCRSLKTYGITFFDVQLKLKDKSKKKVDLQLGVTRDGVLIMDPLTKEITKEYPLTHLRRWAAGPNSFTLDFGDHEDDYMILLTSEGENISALLAGYIDILLKKRREGQVVAKDDKSEVGQIDQIGRHSARAVPSTTTSVVSSFDSLQHQQQIIPGVGMAQRQSVNMTPQRILPTTVNTAQTFCATLIGDLNKANVGNTGMSAEQWKQQLNSSTESVLSSVGKYNALKQGNTFNKAQMDAKAAEIAANLAQLVTAARNAAARKDGSEDVDLLQGAKKVADAIKDLLASSKELADHPNDPKALERYNIAQSALRYAVTYLNSANKGILTDGPSQELLLASGNNVFVQTLELSQTAQDVSGNKKNVVTAAEKAKESAEQLKAEVFALSPAITSPEVQKQVQESCRLVETNIAALMSAAGKSDDPNSALNLAAKSVADALKQLLASSILAEGKSEGPDFSSSAREIFDHTARIINSEGKPQEIKASVSQLVSATSKLVQSAKHAAILSSPEEKNRLLKGATTVAEATKNLVGLAGAATSNPNDKASHKALQESAKRLAEETRELVGDSSEKQAFKDLRGAAKIAAANTTTLISASKSAIPKSSDEKSKEALKDSSNRATEAVSKLVSILQKATANPDDPKVQDALFKQSNETAPTSYKLVASSKSAIPSINDSYAKTQLRQAADAAAEALQKLVAAGKLVQATGSHQEIDQSLERISAEKANLDLAILDSDSGNLPPTPGQSQEGFLELVKLGARQITSTTKVMSSEKTNPQKLGPASKTLADSISQVNSAAINLASTIPDRSLRKDILEASKSLTEEGNNTLLSVKGLLSNSEDPTLASSLDKSMQNLADSVNNLLNATKGGQAGGKECDEAIEFIKKTKSQIKPKPSNPKEFASITEMVENSVKAIQAASSTLVSSARNNPKNLGSSARTLSSSFPPFVEDSNSAAGACPNKEIGNSITNSTHTIADNMIKLIQAAKMAALTEDSVHKQNLTVASNSLSESLDKLISVINTAAPGHKGLEDALKILAQAAQKLDGILVPGSVSESSVEDLKRATTNLAEATKGIISTSSKDPEKMGGYGKDSALSIMTIVESSKRVAEFSKVSMFSDAIQKVKDPATEVVESCESNDPSAKQNMLKAARDVTTFTHSLVEAVKTHAATLQEPDKTNITNLAQTVTQATSQFVLAIKGAASGGPLNELKQNHQRLLDALNHLQFHESGKVEPPKAKKLISATREATINTTKMVQAAQELLKKPTDMGAQSSLSTAARNVGASIKSLLEVAKSVGEIDLEEAIEAISQAITELDSASISATVGLLENKPIPGKTAQNLEEDLVQISRTLAASIKNLVHPNQRSSPLALANAAKSTSAILVQLADQAKSLASSRTDPDKQLEILSMAKSIADTCLLLLNACKQNDTKEIGAKIKISSQAIATLLNALKGNVMSLRECDDAFKIIAESGKILDSPPPTGNRPYADTQSELTSIAKALVASISEIISQAQNNPSKVGESAKKLAGNVINLVEATYHSLSSVPDEAQQGLLQATKAVISASAKIVQSGKLMSSDNKNSKNLQQISAAHEEVTSSIANFIGAIKASATGELKCGAAVESINRNIADLDAAALYAATGSLESSEETDMEQMQNELVESCKMLAQDIKAIVTAANQNQNQLGNASQDGAQKFDKLAKDCKTTASLLSNLLNQQEVLGSGKAVGVALQGTIKLALESQRNPANQEIKAQVTTTSQTLTQAIRDLVTLAQNIAGAVSSGVRELDNARKGIAQALLEFNTAQGNSKAGASDVLKSTKDLASSIATIFTVCTSGDDPTKLSQASDLALESTKSLLLNSKGAAKLTDKQNGDNLIEIVKQTAEYTTQLLSAAKNQRKQQTPDTLAALSNANNEMVRLIGEIVDAAKPLPGSEEALKLLEKTDELEQLAEQELMNAASAIESATNTLIEAKKRAMEMRKNKDSPLPEEEIAEAILEACKAITTATGTLVGAASNAQKELVNKGKTNKNVNLYRRDPTWAQGLISASQEVAGTVKNLVEVANNASKGTGQDINEALIAASRGVAGSTARLVFASRAKADPFSPSQKQLTGAAKAVANATHQLVQAAKSNETEEEVKPDWGAMTDMSRKKIEMDKQVEILRLQKELETKQRELGQLRKQDYAKSRGGK